MSLSGGIYGAEAKFKSSLNVESNNGCYVKLTVPILVDFTGKDFETIKSSGMLVDSDGNEQFLGHNQFYSNLDDQERTETWFAIEGCQFNIANRDSMRDFE